MISCQARRGALSYVIPIASAVREHHPDEILSRLAVIEAKSPDHRFFHIVAEVRNYPSGVILPALLPSFRARSTEILMECGSVKCDFAFSRRLCLLPVRKSSF